MVKIQSIAFMQKLAINLYGLQWSEYKERYGTSMVYINYQHCLSYVGTRLSYAATVADQDMY